MEKNRTCPECKKQGHDSTDSHMFLMSDGRRWCCTHKEYHKSGEVYYEDAEGNAIDGSKDNSISNLLASLGMEDSPTALPLVPPVFTEVPSKREDIREEYRGILPATFKHYQTQGEYSKSGELLLLANPLYETDTNKHLVDKIRKLPKDFYATGKTGKGTKIQLFGQNIAKGAKKLLVTEGELDAMSAHQMFQASKYCKGVQVVSLPLGANAKTIIDNPKFFKAYKEIYIAVDQDEAGEKVSRDIASVLPHAKFLTFSEKDANKMLTEHKEDEFINALFSADVYKPESIVRVSSIIPEILEKPTWGRPWPWPTLTAATYGRRDGEGMFVGAGVKSGKSEWINEVIAFDVKNKDPIGVIKFEELPKMTAKRIAGKIDHTFYHRPDVPYNDADLEKTVRSFENELILHQAFGTASWDSIKPFITYCVFSGCKTIIIDPITKITNSMSASDTETELRRFSDELACMAQDLGFFYIVTCHLKAPVKGPSHERGGKVNTFQFRGSRAMSENCYYFLGIERNKDPELTEEQRNTSEFVLLEDRAFGNVVSFPVVYDRTTQSYLEPTISTNF